jgi:hypothetical protein
MSEIGRRMFAASVDLPRAFCQNPRTLARPAGLSGGPAKGIRTR